MQKEEGPGGIPEWKIKLGLLGPFARAKFAVGIGATARTVKNWADGKTIPSDATIERIKKQLTKLKGQK